MKKYIILAIIIIVAIIAIVTISNREVLANSSYFPASGYLTTSDTTTVETLNPNDQIDFVYDTYLAGSNTKSDSATLLIQSTASTSATILYIATLYSQDGIDYYEQNFGPATTSPAYVTDVTESTYWSMSGNDDASTTMKVIKVETPTRYIKIGFIGTVSTSTIWAQLVPVKENSR